MKAMDVDATILARRAKIVDALRKIVPARASSNKKPAGVSMRAMA
jgi:hypothetical protein